MRNATTCRQVRAEISRRFPKAGQRAKRWGLSWDQAKEQTKSPEAKLAETDSDPLEEKAGQ